MCLEEGSDENTAVTSTRSVNEERGMKESENDGGAKRNTEEGLWAGEMSLTLDLLEM